MTLSIYMLIHVGIPVFIAILKILLRSLFQIIKASIEWTHALSDINVDHVCFCYFLKEIKHYRIKPLCIHLNIELLLALKTDIRFVEE